MNVNYKLLNALKEPKKIPPLLFFWTEYSLLSGKVLCSTYLYMRALVNSEFYREQSNKNYFIE